MAIYPTTFLAWVTLPGDESPTSIALGIKETHKLPNQVLHSFGEVADDRQGISNLRDYVGFMKYAKVIHHTDLLCGLFYQNDV